MPKLTAEQQATRRTRILAAAETCFARSGFHGTSMQQICREAGISAGALYLYFDSKEALIEGLAEGERERVLADFAQMRDVPDFLTGMDHLTKNCIQQMTLDKTTIFLEVIAESTRNPAVRQTLQRVDRAIKGAMRELFARAYEGGRIAPNVSVDHLVNAMAVMFDGLLLRRSIDPNLDIQTITVLMMQTFRSMATGDQAMPAPARLEAAQ